jgi:hypothetical protein
MLDADFTDQGGSRTFETPCERFAINDPIISQIAESAGTHKPSLV